jgi:2-amino-4-hydroxy-6-hydroxymethyldihydropteridine diphosphokinase
MQAAVRTLQEHPCVRVDLDRGVASLYETSPVGEAAGPGLFLNSALRITTVLSPIALLTEVLSIETALGRVRPDPHGCRLIDIDVLLFGNIVMTDEHLSLPHPRMHERRFVLEPLSEIAPSVLHPVLRITVAALARQRRDEQTAETVVRIADRTWHRVLATVRPACIAATRGACD